MRITDFKGAAKIQPLKHKTLEGLYVPELSFYEIQEAMLIVGTHAIEVAESELSEMKESLSKRELSPSFNFNGEGKAAWGTIAPPKNAYEGKVFERAGAIYASISLTMFICDKEGNCLHPFVEPFGTASPTRTEFFSAFIQDMDAVNEFNNLLVFNKIAANESEEQESPNDKKSVVKKK